MVVKFGRNLKIKFFAMPAMLKIIFLLAVFSPLLVVLSVTTGSVFGEGPVYDSYGDAKNILEVILVLMGAAPLFLSAILILKKNPNSRIVFSLGWVVFCLSPLMLSAVEYYKPSFLGQFIFNFLIGSFLVGYLFFSKEVDGFFGGAGEK